ncbi:facilitated trehalose transporter Tret1-like [Diorhabda carinulata]|uniref:facilitated trehalose transporter Tret1-like n=1 Tax=Diorhabda carinulata TaxID=1163345 RepID=UPI0025A01261|nr:facilitated trehalose transporter Tret1-like [Diorhabda carinulata]XP_057658236.1 facilitated trehalose transporter Tret1-like [Diorhabda carinulata]
MPEDIPSNSLQNTFPDKVLSANRTTKTKKDTKFFFFVIVLALLPCITGGGRMVWTSSALIKLSSTDSNINPLGRPITTAETSLMVGLPGIIALPAAILFAKLADVIGRKRCMQVIGFGMLFSLIGLAFSNSVPLMITFLTCMSYLFSATSCVFSIYFTEICEDHNRAKFGSLLSTCLILGQLYSNAIGPFLGIRYYSLLLAAPLLPFLIFFFFAPETPMYLFAKGKKDECLQALRKLRSNKSEGELLNDFNKILGNLTLAEKHEKKNISQLFSTKESRFGFLLGVLSMLFQTISGGPILIPLIAPIFNQYNLIISGETVAVSISIVKVMSLFLTFMIIERIGRRPLLIVSSAGSGISMLLLGTFFYFLIIDSPLFDQVQWLPFPVILFYYLVYGIGLCSIPTPMISVLFTIEMRSMSSSLVFTIEHVLVASCQLVYPLLAESVGSHWCMWIFAINCFIASLILYWLMPETRGKSIDEIQHIFKNHRYSKTI